jgi:antibiotic biosynthesis monooxygenase (ABM) superfamily enzyme
VVDSFELGLNFWFDGDKQWNRNPKYRFKFALCQVFQSVVVNEFDVFVGKWEWSCLFHIPEFKAPNH